MVVVDLQKLPYWMLSFWHRKMVWQLENKLFFSPISHYILMILLSLMNGIRVNIEVTMSEIGPVTC